MSPEPYSTYRPSGVPWLADVPVHWEMRRGPLAISQDG